MASGEDRGGGRSGRSDRPTSEGKRGSLHLLSLSFDRMELQLAISAKVIRFDGREVFN